LQFKTPYTNTYAGTGWMQQGEMILDGVIHQPVISGSFVIGTSNGAPSSERVGYIKGEQIGDGVPVTILKSGILALQGWSDTIGSLAGSGQLDLSNGTLTVGANNLSTTFSGQIIGTGTFTKTGSAMLTLSGTNTYSGVTTNLSGTLLVNGILNSSAVYVRSGSTLGGTGQVQAISTFFNGLVSPGASAGNLTASTLLPPNGGRLRIEINGLIPAVEYDRLTASGSVTLGGVLELIFGFTPAHGDSFTILSKTSAGPISGSFSGLPEGQSFPHAGLLFQITYMGGDGNDAVLTRVPAPGSSLSTLGPDMMGTMAISGVGLPQLLYTLQATTNLNTPVIWTAISTDQADGSGIYEFIDPDAALYPMRFYRAQSP
jgi:autotransporter-associated beta strand protein